MESVTMLLWTSARGVKETGVENPGMWMVHVGVDIPKMEAGTGVSRERASQVPCRGMSSAMPETGRQRGPHSLREQEARGRPKNTCGRTGVTAYNTRGSQVQSTLIRSAKVRQPLQGSVGLVCWLVQSSIHSNRVCRVVSAEP